MSIEYSCWKCGGALIDLLAPLPREMECPHCRAQLYVCRMCIYYDTKVANQCREPVADPVTEKTRANFCGYFQINPNAYSEASNQQDEAKKQLDALFGGAGEAAKENRSAEDVARQQLEDLFKKK